MCNFFSCVSDGNGKIYYFDWKLRKQCIADKLNYNPDSHTSIADYFGFKAEKEDKLNKYEYNPLTKVFIKDQINTTDDSDAVEKLCRKLKFNKIVRPLIIKPIIHPFQIDPPKTVTKKHLKLVTKWASVRASVGASVRASVGDSVRASVRASVGASVRDSVWASVRDSVWASVRASVRASVGASVRASVGDSVGDSVWASVGAYTSSFFDLPTWKYIKHPKGQNPYKPVIDLWNVGLVPSFDGKIWRLHSKNGIVWQGTLDEIK